MIEFIRKWYARYFSHEEAVVVLMVSALAMAVIYWLGAILAPVFASIIIAYLCTPLIDFLKRFKLPDLVSVFIVFIVVFGLLFITILGLVPLVWSQSQALLAELPRMVAELQHQLLVLAAKYPEYVDAKELQAWLNNVAGGQLDGVLPKVVSFSLSTLPMLVGIMIYFVIVPILVFFMLKDRLTLWNNFLQLLPDKRSVLNQIGNEMNSQIANYIRGKIMEIIIVAGVTFIAFTVIGVKYAALLALAVGFSVLVPYVGAVVVTIPVMLVAFFQYGFGGSFYTVFITYMIIQALDGNVLVPLLFSEAVNLNPVFIIVAVLVFGGVWGIWGVFFAIPLATLIKAIANAWPRVKELHQLKE